MKKRKRGATELVLAREQHLSQLDGLAAAAAHELGTPLATITLIAKELQLALRPDSEHADDVRILNEQAKRCRTILGKLSELSSGDPFDRMKLSALIEEVVAPHRHFGVAIDVALAAGDAAEPVGGRNPAILYGLGNLLENAVDFARERVEVALGVVGLEGGIWHVGRSWMRVLVSRDSKRSAAGVPSKGSRPRSSSSRG